MSSSEPNRLTCIAETSQKFRTTLWASGGNNVVANNFGAMASSLMSPELTDGGGNVMGNPNFNGIGCGAFVPSGQAAAYGRWR